MLQMGGDFGFGDANAWFKNLDILLKAVNKEGRVNVSKTPHVANLLGTRCDGLRPSPGWWFVFVLELTFAAPASHSCGVTIFPFLFLSSLMLLSYRCAYSSLLFVSGRPSTRLPSSTQKRSTRPGCTCPSRRTTSSPTPTAR